jgi:LysR family transcriptional activator of nhaA
VASLNFHHLRCFRAVAHAKSLTDAARQLHLSPSALSVQVKALEGRLGHALFERRARRLVLTEAGRLALAHADSIFTTGDELLALLAGRPAARPAVLRVGSAATLSRNFQLQWLRPVLARGDASVRLVSGTLRELLAMLAAHTLDVVLANEPVARDTAAGWVSRAVAEQPLALVSAPPIGPQAPRRAARGRRALAEVVSPVPFPHGLHGAPLVLPGGASPARAAFDALLADAGVLPLVIAEVDDMAMLRLLARETGALTLVPPVVVADELLAGTLVQRAELPMLVERFWAVTVQRRFPHPLLRELFQGSGAGR